MTLLLLDIGNSRLKWGVLENGAIDQRGNVELSEFQNQGLSLLASRLPRDVGSVIACNVAGKTIARSVSEAIASHCGQSVFFVQPAAEACGVTSAYQEPDRLGVDRWVAMIGARAAHNTSCLVVDAGTAITLDALDSEGQHLGGQIVPGLVLMADTLGENTSDLPSISMGKFKGELSGAGFARSTSAAITHGIFAAAVGAIELAVRTLTELGHDPTVLLTGGDAAVLQRHVRFTTELRPHLILEGLARLSLSNQ